MAEGLGARSPRSARRKMKIKHVRRVVRELMKVQVDRSGVEAQHVTAQDTLAFAAMLLGMKPVFLLGRGFDDPSWISSVGQLASKLRLEIDEGVCWEPECLRRLDLPTWFRESLTAGPLVTYISSTQPTASEVRKICARGFVSPAEEALLL